MTKDENEPLARYLTRLRLRAGMSLDEVASAAGYAGRSSVQRYFQDENIDVLDPKIASRIGRALLDKGDPPILMGELARLVSLEPERLMDSLEALSNILKIGKPAPRLTPTSVKPQRSGMLPVMGVAHASNWMERAPSLDEPESWLAIPFESYQPRPGQYALRIVGSSVNKTAPEGHFAICQRYGEAAQSPPAGKFVHVQRSRGDFIEWTIKKVRWDEGQVLLCPDSDHPDHQEPIEFGADGDEVRILGIVTGWYRPA